MVNKKPAGPWFGGDLRERIKSFIAGSNFNDPKQNRVFNYLVAVPIVPSIFAGEKDPLESTPEAAQDQVGAP